MKKRFISLILSLSMLMSICIIIPNSASAASSGTLGSNLTWVLDDAGTLTIDGTGGMPGWLSDAVVPWYSKRASINKVVLSDGVTSIGNYAFKDCTNLKRITGGDNLTSIGNGAFENCVKLTSFDIPNGVTSIGYGAFYDCDSIARITIPDGVKKIDKQTFYTCDSLTEVTIGSGVTSIESTAFAGCKKLAKITIGNSLTSVGDCAFFECVNLTDVYYAGSEDEWKRISIASDNIYLKNAIIHYPNKYTISYNANGGSGAPSAQTKKEGESIILSSEIPVLKDSFFLGWATSADATDVEYPSGATFNVDSDTILYAVWKLTTVAGGTLGSNLTWTLDSGGTLTISGTGGMPNYWWASDVPWYRYCERITKVVIENGITSIGESAFSSCYYITDVYYRGNKSDWDKISIGLGNDYLTKATIHFTNIYTVSYNANGGSGAPSSQTKKEGESITLSTVVPVCEGYTFLGWATSADATEAEYQSGATYNVDSDITLYAVWKWNYVAGGKCGENLKWTLDSEGTLNISGTGEMTDYTKISEIPWYGNRNNITEIVIEDGVTRIGNRGFYNCISAEKIAIPNSVESIGTYAFGNCDVITIYAEKGSYAHAYATENNIPFVNTKITVLETMTVEMIQSDKKWYFDVSIEGYDEEPVVYVAVYNENGKLLGLTTDTLTVGDITTLSMPKSGSEDATYAKVFIWNDDFSPVAALEVIEL